MSKNAQITWACVLALSAVAAGSDFAAELVSATGPFDGPSCGGSAPALTPLRAA